MPEVLVMDSIIIKIKFKAMIWFGAFTPRRMFRWAKWGGPDEELLKLAFDEQIRFIEEKNGKNQPMDPHDLLILLVMLKKGDFDSIQNHRSLHDKQVLKKYIISMFKNVGEKYTTHNEQKFNPPDDPFKWEQEPGKHPILKRFSDALQQQALLLIEKSKPGLRGMLAEQSHNDTKFAAFLFHLQNEGFLYMETHQRTDTSHVTEHDEFVSQLLNSFTNNQNPKNPSFDKPSSITEGERCTCNKMRVNSTDNFCATCGVKFPAQALLPSATKHESVSKRKRIRRLIPSDSDSDDDKPPKTSLASKKKRKFNDDITNIVFNEADFTNDFGVDDFVTSLSNCAKNDLKKLCFCLDLSVQGQKKDLEHSLHQWAIKKQKTQ